MKKLVSLAIAAILVFVLAVPAFALEPETQVIDLGTVDLGNGVSYHTVLTIENSALRASVKKRQYYTRLFLLWRGNRKCSA